ncbi:hypothetical protein HanRHA438_Chr06g0280261 [Helianthus annuus]|nr:hypothetical protein HanRHA438_Chr06g0280261 [Helianthus annuus]
MQGLSSGSINKRAFVLGSSSARLGLDKARLVSSFFSSRSARLVCTPKPGYLLVGWAYPYPIGRFPKMHNLP